MKFFRFSVFCFLLFPFVFYGQTNLPVGTFTDEARPKNTLRICFYNLENFFDTQKDSSKNDKDFTPEGSYRWTFSRFEQKAANLVKVFVAMGGWECPEIIGVCEIENKKAIQYLLYSTALKKYKYEYVHYESPDRRGIDVALFYRKNKFEVIYSEPVPVVDTSNLYMKTRDILYVKGVLPHKRKDTLHLFVNHWPSRYGGASVSVPKRNKAASVLRLKIDSITNIIPDAAIVIMGDFNDEPTSQSFEEYLNAKIHPDSITGNDLLNLTYPYLKSKTGTCKFQKHWYLFDQIIVSASMLKAEKGWKIKSTAYIFNMDFLLEKDERYLGTKPFRTYNGRKYNGGFSDHLPIFIDAFCQ